MRRRPESHRDEGPGAIRPGGPGHEAPGPDGQPGVRQPHDGLPHTQLGHTQAELDAERFFWTILDESPDALFLYEVQTERIVDVNRNACESLGYAREELIGKTPRDFDPNVMRDEGFLLRTNERLLHGETFSFETLHRRRDGVEFPVEVRVRPCERDGRAFVVAQARDITERKLAEEQHRQYVRFLEGLERVNRAMCSTDDFEKMVNGVLDAMLEVFDCDRALLGTYAGERERTSFTVARRDRRDFPSPFRMGAAYPIEQDFKPLSEALKAAAGARQFSATSEPPLPRTLVERAGLQSVLAISLLPRLDDRDYFMMLGQCSRPRVWTAEEMRLFQEISLRVGDALGILYTLRNLRLSEERLEEAQRIAHVGWWERDLQTNRIYLSNEVRRIFGLGPGEVEQWLIHPEDRARATEVVTRAMRSAARYHMEYRVIRPDGEVRVVRSQGEVTRDDASRPVRLFGTLQDVTELRRAEEELRASDARFRTFVDHATDGFFLHDEQLTIVDVNRYACDRLGYSREELIGMHARHFDAGLDDASAARIAERLGAGETVTFESRHRCKDGTLFPVEVRLRRFRLGERVLGLSLVRDITERKRAEQRMLAQHAVARALSEARSLDEAGPMILRSICESLDWDLGALWRIDPETEVLRCAQLWHKPELQAAAFEEATRSSAFAPGVGLPGRVWSSRAPACVHDVLEDEGFLRAGPARLDGLHAAFAFPILLGDEVLGVIDFLSREIRQPDPDLLSTMATIGSQVGQFIERKRAEASLQQAQAQLAHVARVTTMGELTASIAHEVNQPLGAMVTSAAACARWLAAEPPQMEKAQRALERIVSDGKRAGQVIGRVRSLLKRQPPQLELLDLNKAIREVVELARGEAWRHDVGLQARLADGLPPVRGDRVQLQQVFLNLFVNAIEAMSGIEGRPRVLSVVTADDGPGTLRVEVRDTGPGVDPARAQQLFDAFYTTKPEGIGMGLAISRSIIEAHGGRLSVVPNEPNGAAFLVSLPLEGASA